MSRPIVYFVGSAYNGCNYVRCLLPQIYGGYDGSLTSIEVGGRKNEKMVASEINEADIVVFHRPDSINHHKVGMKLAKAGKLIFFDNYYTPPL